MKFQFNDGGRSEAGYKGVTGDCVTRAIAIATELPYQQVYDELNKLTKTERKTKKMSKSSNARTGVYRKTYEKFLFSLGWVWKPTMLIGQGCKVHLIDGELPNGRLIVAVSKHLTAVIDGVINDLYNPDRNGSEMGYIDGVEFRRTTGRCVYGYYYLPS